MLIVMSMLISLTYYVLTSFIEIQGVCVLGVLQANTSEIKDDIGQLLNIAVSG